MSLRARSKRRLIVPFLGPAVVVYLVMAILPAIQAFNLSFFDWSGFGTNATFVGTDNFTAILSDRIYWRSLLNNVLLLVVGGSGVFALAFLAVALFPLGSRLRGWVRIVMFLPAVIPLVALALLWSFVYNYDFGPLNELARALGLKELGSIIWMGPDMIQWSVIVALVWASAGFYIVLFMAAVDRLPPELAEAAIVEGANRFQIFRHVTLPLIWNIVVIAVVFWIIDAMNQFTFVFSVGSTSGQPLQSIWTLPIYIFELGIGTRTPSLHLGAATAMAVTLLVLIAVMIVIARRILRRPPVEY